MKIRTYGIGIIILGILMTVYTSVNYVTTKEVAEVGALKINKDTKHHIPWSPLAGVVLLAVGAIVLFKAK